jgi:hypothetical protein
MRLASVVRTLESACVDLGLSAPIRRALVARVLRQDPLRTRNESLAEAASLIAPGLGPWEQAAQLEQAMAHFERRLPRLSSGALVPAPHELALLQAWGSGARPVRSRRRLYGILSAALTNALPPVSDSRVSWSHHHQTTESRHDIGITNPS